MERSYFLGIQTAFNGEAIIFSSLFSVTVFLALEMLLFDDVLRDEWLVPDENEDPKDITELGRCISVAFSFNGIEHVLRNFGAAIIGNQ